MSSPIAVTLVGATGLTGSAALRSLLASPVAFAVTALTRRDAPAAAPANAATSYTNRVVSDLSAAAAADAEPLATKGGVFVTALGTTRAQAGSAEAQEKIDLVLNRELAQRARNDGAETIIVVSSGGANASSWSAYLKWKGQLEDDIKAMGFARSIFLRPGMLLYEGSRPDSRTAEAWLGCAIRGMRYIGLPTTALGIDGEDVGAAIAQLTANPPEGVTTLYDAEIVKLAKEFRASQQASPAK